MGAPGGVDHAVTTAERLAPKHPVQDGRDLLAMVGMLVPQQQSGGGHHQAWPVTAHVGNRVRPLPALAVDVEPEPADPLRVALPDDQVNRAELLGHHGRGHSGNPIRHSIGGRLLSGSLRGDVSTHRIPPSAQSVQDQTWLAISAPRL
jgi:hypothetical protein